ncbi:glycoside hydrolase [Thermoanaerobacterium thermosaccharolyticum]|uniref:glycosyl hydrolase family 18 protein n=1 Tax=Thermoanaerobacterium thermosaccharolyticum TaxID=1517 RepID=UPI000C084FEE|nr:glycosyl hydrolase family 18 protein [Thermoanaerobacterium thermosaccharolyticum]PHO08031.1 glycoside hydrolase [Thermoanaerobacterium thermosaccharolyticum]
MRKISKKHLLIILTLVILVSLLSWSPVLAATSVKNFVVYFPNWGMYNAAHNNMSVDMIPWDKVTVINHAFFTVDSNYKLVSTDDYADFQASFPHSEGWDPGMIRGHFGEYKYYKAIYPNVKVLVSVGGWTRGENFHAMASSYDNRKIFIDSVISFLKEYPFIDGIDIDWEYPGINRAPDPNDQYDRGCPGGPEDKENFTLLLKEIREAYNANGMSNKLLTVAVPGGYDKVDLTQPDIYSQYVDWLNVMTYDMHGAWDSITNHQSPIYLNPLDPSPTSPIDIKNKYNTDFIMKYYRDRYNVPSNKLNVGSPFYSRGWKNVDVTTGINGLFANANGAPIGNLDNPQSPGGQNSYSQMEILEKTSGYVKYRDEYSLVPWLYNVSEGTMYTYEDTISAAARCDYVINNGFGGIVAWEISNDDPNGFPLTTTIANKFGIGGGTASQVATPVFSPTGGTYTSAQNITISCATSGATIYYTTDGTDPTTNALVYSGPINISTTTTIKALAVAPGMTNSKIASATYTISNSTIPEWAPNTYYKIGDLVTYNGITYKCIQAHTSLVGWEPPNVPALWQVQ